MNHLRHFLPNYVYTYGYTKCAPLLISGRKVETWCTYMDDPVSYLILENVRDAITLKEFISIPGMTFITFFPVLLQILNALNLAYKTYGFTHYDLHYQNILSPWHVSKSCCHSLF